MKVKNFITKLMTAGVLNSLALMLVAQSANQACVWFYHQPELPEAASKFKRH